MNCCYFPTFCYLTTVKGWFLIVVRKGQHSDYSCQHQGLTTDLSFNMKMELSPQAIAEAIKIGIDAFKQANQRGRTAILENEARESGLADKAQARQIAEQKAEQERQMGQLELKLRRLKSAIEIASNFVDVLYPCADEETRAKEIQVWLLSILRYLNEGALESVLSAPQNKIIVTAEDKLS